MDACFNGDTLMALAIKADMPWKRIVKANRLKKPYDLALYETIRLPKHKLALVKLKEKVAQPNTRPVTKKGRKKK
jgi:hypothetical protein